MKQDQQQQARHLYFQTDLSKTDIAETVGVSRSIYLSLITDVYLRRIMGYCLWPTLKKEEPHNALEKAVAEGL